MDEDQLSLPSPDARSSPNRTRKYAEEEEEETVAETGLEMGGADRELATGQRKAAFAASSINHLVDCPKESVERDQSAGTGHELLDINNDSSENEEEKQSDIVAHAKQKKKRFAGRKKNVNQTSTSSLMLPVVKNKRIGRLLTPRRQRKGYPPSVSRSLNQKTSVFTKIREFKVDFMLPGGTVLPYTCQGDWTVKQIKAEVWDIMRDLGILDEYLENMDSYVLKYEKDNDMYELYEERQIFQTLSVVIYWRARSAEAGQFEIAPKRVETPEELKMNSEISRLVGIKLNELAMRKKDEVTTARRIFVGVRRSAVNSRDPTYYSMEPELRLSPIPPHIKKALDASGKIIVKIYTGSTFTALRVPCSYSPFQILQDFFPDNPIKKQRLNLPIDSEIQDYILKVCGRSIYLTGPDKIIDFVHVRDCLAALLPVCIALVPSINSDNDTPRILPEPDLIDDYTGLAGSYKQLSALTKDHTQVFTLASWDISQNFRVLVKGIDRLKDGTDCVSVCVEVGISHGGKALVQSRHTKEIRYARNPRWCQHFVFDIETKNLPKAARLFCNVLVRKADVKKKRRFSTIPRNFNIEDFTKWGHSRSVHQASLQLFDYRSVLVQGPVKLPLKCSSFTSVQSIGATILASSHATDWPVLHLELDQFAHSVAYPNSDTGWSLTNGHSELTRSPTGMQSPRFMSIIKEIVSSDPLKELESHERELLWRFRWSLLETPEALPWLLRCVNWGCLDSVIEVHKLIQDWRSSEITLEVALQLLNSNCVDENVRSLAVERLESLTNDELLVYLLQLVQVLKFEPHHDSALARFLLKRALGSKRIGHYFYWFLRAEMGFLEVKDRFGLLLEAYLRGCGEATLAEIKNQHQVFDFFAETAANLKSVDKRDRAGYLAKALSDSCLPDTFSPAYNPSIKIGKLQVHHCKHMDSKKMPLWLEFVNMDPTCIKDKPIELIFKHGDDLRQDMLTLQMLKLMDRLWKEEGLNLHILPYGCMSTGFEVGMIEVVSNASTVAKIQRICGGSFGAFKDDCLCNWLKQHNPRPADFKAAVEKFALSCAGYCVATFVLGIGDRHNDNIMLTESGNLVHIDFGHFLGNTKTFMGIKRERAPFVLTPDFVYIMGKKGSRMFLQFQDTCAKAYNVIRRRAHLFINLFSMMKHTGIPELRSVEDIDYLRNVLVLNKSEPDAAQYFKDKIEECLRLNWSTQLNWLAHNVVH